MTPRSLYIFLLFLTACILKTDKKKANSLLGQRITFKESELAVACTRAIKTLDNEIHGVSFIGKTGQSVSIDTVNSLLYKISKYDIMNNDRFDTYLKTCNCLEVITWMPKTHNSVITRIERFSFKTNIPLNNGSNNTISITDFDIYSVEKPSHIVVRIIDDYNLEYIKFEDKECIKVAESIPVGLDIAIARLESAKNNTCR